MRWRGYIPVLAVVSVFVLSAVVPFSWLEGIPLCFFHEITGRDCPGCGLTRAFNAFFHLDWRRGIALNAMAPVLILLFALYGVQSVRRLSDATWQWSTSPQGRAWISRSFLVLFLGQWLWKLGH